MLLLALAESIQLVPDGTIFFHILLIIVMISVLNRVLYRPFVRLLEQRERDTRGRSDEARGIIGQVDEKLTAYERSMREARAEGYRLLEQAQSESAAERGRRLAEVRAEVERMTEAETAAIRAQADRAKTELGEEAVRMAAALSSQILGRPVSQ